MKDVFGITIKSAREEEIEQDQIREYMTDLIDEATSEYDTELWKNLEEKINRQPIDNISLTLTSSTENCSTMSHTITTNPHMDFGIFTQVSFL